MPCHPPLPLPLPAPQVGASIAAAIAIHNIPEGICVALPIYYATGSRWKVGCLGWVWRSSCRLPCVLCGTRHQLVVAPKPTHACPPWATSVPLPPTPPLCTGLLVGQPHRVCGAAGRPDWVPCCARAGKPSACDCHALCPGSCSRCPVTMAGRPSAPPSRVCGLRRAGPLPGCRPAPLAAPWLAAPTGPVELCNRVWNRVRHDGEHADSFADLLYIGCCAVVWPSGQRGLASPPARRRPLLTRLPAPVSCRCPPRTPTTLALGRCM